jgi:hypothetical protein
MTGAILKCAVENDAMAWLRLKTGCGGAMIGRIKVVIGQIILSGGI